MAGYCADCSGFRKVLWRRDDLLRCAPCTLESLAGAGIVEKDDKVHGHVNPPAPAKPKEVLLEPETLDAIPDRCPKCNTGGAMLQTEGMGGGVEIRITMVRCRACAWAGYLEE